MCELIVQLRHQLWESLLEGLAVVLDLLGADVPPRREDVPLVANLVESRALAEARHVGVVTCALVATPGVIGAGNPLDVLRRQFPLCTRAVDHPPQLAGVDEEHLPPAIPGAVVPLVAGQE